MGYDPYDYYDLGEFDQKGSVPTWFGTKAELLALIDDAHQNNLSVIADIVINHSSGADAQELNPLSGQSRWTLFNPKSNKFPRNWESFHPNMYESWDEMAFGDMPDLSHRNPYVYAELLKLARWLIEEVGFDGFRYDFVKGYGANTITAIQEYRYMRDGQAGSAIRRGGILGQCACHRELGRARQLFQQQPGGRLRLPSTRDAQGSVRSIRLQPAQPGDVGDGGAEATPNGRDFRGEP